MRNVAMQKRHCNAASRNRAAREVHGTTGRDRKRRTDMAGRNTPPLESGIGPPIYSPAEPDSVENRPARGSRGLPLGRVGRRTDVLRSRNPPRSFSGVMPSRPQQRRGGSAGRNDRRSGSEPLFLFVFCQVFRSRAMRQPSWPPVCTGRHLFRSPAAMPKRQIARPGGRSNSTSQDFWPKASPRDLAANPSFGSRRPAALARAGVDDATRGRTRPGRGCPVAACEPGVPSVRFESDARYCAPWGCCCCLLSKIENVWSKTDEPPPN